MKKDSEAIFAKITSVYQQGEVVQKENDELQAVISQTKSELVSVKDEL